MLLLQLFLLSVFAKADLQTFKFAGVSAHKTTAGHSMPCVVTVSLDENNKIKSAMIEGNAKARMGVLAGPALSVFEYMVDASTSTKEELQKRLDNARTYRVSFPLNDAELVGNRPPVEANHIREQTTYYHKQDHDNITAYYHRGKFLEDTQTYIATLKLDAARNITGLEINRTSRRLLKYVEISSCENLSPLH